MKCISNSIDCVNTNFSIKKIINYLNTLEYKPFLFSYQAAMYGSSPHKLKESSKLKPKDLYGNLKLKSEKYIKKITKIVQF